MKKTQLFSQYYFGEYDNSIEDSGRKRFEINNKQQVFELCYESLYDEFFQLSIERMTQSEGLLFIFDVNKNNDQKDYFITKINEIIEYLERNEKIVITILVGYIKKKDKENAIEMLEQLVINFKSLRMKYNTLFSICNLKMFSDTEDIAIKHIVKCIENSYEIDYVKLLEDILAKRNIERIIEKNSTTRENSCLLM